MRSRTGGRSRNAFWAFAGIGGLLTAVWLLTYLIPSAREMTLDFGFSFLLSLVVTGLLWWTDSQSAEGRQFWRLLAAGWAMNLLGNLVWGAYEMLTGKSLSLFSLVDGFYIFRYILILVAFWRVSPWRGSRQWRDLTIATLVAIGVTWVLLFRPVLAATEPTLFYFLAFYPVLDAVMFCVVLMVWIRAAPGHLRNAIGFFLLGTVFYGAANWVNLRVHLVPAEASSSLASLLWPLTDVVTGVAALYVSWQAMPRMSNTAQ